MAGISYEKYIFNIKELLKTNTLSDSKRQQTTTVDNKRLFNGLLLTRVAPLQQNNSLDDNKEVQTSHYSKSRNARRMDPTQTATATHNHF